MAGFSVPILRVFDQGEVAAGAKVYVYQTGTTTPVTTYSDAGLTTPNAHPVVADTNGEVKLFVAATNKLRIDLYTSADVLIRSVDPVFPVPDVAGLTATATELNRLSGATEGSATALKALIANSLRRISNLDRIDIDEGSLLPFIDNNILINPSFSINQRAPATNADDSYAHDRWYALTQTGTIAVSTVTDAENTTPHMARLTQSQASAQRMGYAQIIEGKNCRHLRGQQVTFKVNRFRCSASQAIRFAVLEWTGTEDSVTSDIVNDWTSSSYTAGNFFLGSNLTVTSVTSSTPGAATLTNGADITVTLGSSFNNLIVFVWTEGTAAQSVTLDLAKVHLGLGSVANPFCKRDFSEELLLCQRYFQKTFPLATTPAQNAGITGAMYLQGDASVTSGRWVSLPTRMRTAPTVTTYNPSATNANFRDVTAGADRTAAVGYQADHGFAIEASSVTAGNDNLVHYTAESEL